MALVANQLIETACARTGLRDFGSDTWREGFEILLRSVTEEAALSEVGEQVFAERITTTLASRLEVEDWFRRHPEIGAQEISPALFGVGLPRTGSTALASLLALDPARRSLRTWEAEKPCPPPTTATEHTDPRIARAESELAATRQMFPEHASMLPVTATGPQECIYGLALDFRSGLFESMGRLPTYNRWLMSCDMEPAYRYHRRVLQLLQWRCPPRKWFLKTPCHMADIAVLDRVFPGARFVMTHRALLNSLTSSAALIVGLSRALTTEPDPLYQGQRQMNFYNISLQRLLAFRDAGNEDRFFDIQFADFQADPFNVIRGLYEWLGEEFSAEAEARMKKWWNENRMQREPSRYHPQDFGINPRKVEERFSIYNERFLAFR